MEEENVYCLEGLDIPSNATEPVGWLRFKSKPEPAGTRALLKGELPEPIRLQPPELIKALGALR